MLRCSSAFSIDDSFPGAMISAPVRFRDGDRRGETRGFDGLAFGLNILFVELD